MTGVLRRTVVSDRIETAKKRRLRNDKDIVILPADKGRVTVVMDKNDYTDKMDTLVNDKQTYEPLKRDPTPALQRRLNGKLLDLKKTDYRHSTILQTQMPRTTIS